jgi:hypothetical protein
VAVGRASRGMSADFVVRGGVLRVEMGGVGGAGDVGASRFMGFGTASGGAPRDGDRPSLIDFGGREAFVTPR